MNNLSSSTVFNLSKLRNQLLRGLLYLICYIYLKYVTIYDTYLIYLRFTIFEYVLLQTCVRQRFEQPMWNGFVVMGLSLAVL